MAGFRPGLYPLTRPTLGRERMMLQFCCSGSARKMAAAMALSCRRLSALLPPSAEGVRTSSEEIRPVTTATVV